MELFFNYIITSLAILSSILAWIAKIKWSHEFKEAKEAEIKAKSAQIDTIKEKAELYESIISRKLMDHSKQTIVELEKLLDETEKSKQEEINKILNKIKESEKAIIDKYLNPDNKMHKGDRYPLLLAMLSHELRTPVNAILGFSELLANENINKEESKQYLEIISKSGENILKVFNDVVEFIKTAHSLTIDERKLD